VNNPHSYNYASYFVTRLTEGYKRYGGTGELDEKKKVSIWGQIKSQQKI